MANGANRLFDVIKQTGESTNGISSQVVSLTIKSVNPLILMRDDRLEIPAEFCILHKSLDINNFRINDIVTAIVLNNGQQYFILYNNTAEEQGTNYNDLSNKPKINGVELKGNKSAGDLELDNYSNLDNKPKINGIELNGNKTSDDLLIVSKSELQQIVQDMTTNINNKVTKSGDTLTGELNFENKNDYAGIRKIRTINNTDYGVSVGVGANGSARMEYYTGPNTLSSVEARSDGVYNGVSGNKLIETKSQVIYHNWQNVILTRSDTNSLYLILYGSNQLKEGTYSIENDFKLITYGTTNSQLTIPKSAITAITRRDWGFQIIINRSQITGIASGQYNGVAVVYDANLILKST